MGVPITIDQIHMVYLEGGKRQTSFRFDTETVDEDYFQERVAEWIHELTEYVCDWENRREMRFLDYLGEITREDSEPYEWDEVEE